MRGAVIRNNRDTIGGYMTKKEYNSGLTVIVEPIASLRSVAVGIMVGTGSAYETPANNGISHFIEHMQFKGTETRSAADIVDEFDSLGAAYNAFTGKEFTCYYFKSIDEKVENCFSVLSDLFLHSAFGEEELDRERKVILEEINMSMDEPDGVCYDLMCKEAFGDCSYGLNILGSKANVSAFGKDDILAYKRTHYIASNTTVCFVGNITVERAQSLVERYMGELTIGEKLIAPTLAPAKFSSGFSEYIRDYEQSEISIAFPAFPLGDDRQVTLSALDSVVGYGMSSRLFQRLREKMGIAYSVYSAPRLSKKAGMFTICVNVNSVNAVNAVKAVYNELGLLLHDGVTDAEVEKAKTQLKVATIFGMEDPLSCMQAILRRQTLLGELLNVDALIADIEHITPNMVNNLAKSIFANKPVLAYTGKVSSDSWESVNFN